MSSVRSFFVVFAVLLVACGDDAPAPMCGDGVMTSEEMCDGAELGGLTCESLGFAPGELSCTASCAPDTSECGAPPNCGDGALTSPEVCDGDLLNGASCESEGFGGGVLACAANCGAFDTSACTAPPGCGDGLIGEGEVCDGDAFEGTCETLGFGPGMLICDRCTAVDTSSCACLPTTCEAEEACGEIPDGCGGTLDCGTECRDPWLTCGGGGDENRCGATCLLSCPDGSACDDVGTCPNVMPLELDIELRETTVRILRNGIAPTDLVDCSNPERIVGYFNMSNPNVPGGGAGGAVRCGTDWTFGPVDVPPGDYVFTVRGRSEADTNMPVPLYGGDIRIDGGEAVVDVPVHRVRGNLRFGDASPTETPVCAAGRDLARLRFETKFFTTDSEIVTTVACGTDFAFDVELYEGEWEVYLDSPNRNYSDVGDERRLYRSFVVDGPTESAVLDLNDRRVRIQGDLRFGGEVPTATSECFSRREAARMTLFRDGQIEAIGTMACDGEFNYEILVEPGEYELIYRTSAGPTNLPGVRVSLGTMTLDADATFDIDLPRRSISGVVTVDGMPLEETPECLPGMVAGNLRVQNKLVPVMCGTGGAFAVEDLSPVEVPCLVEPCAAPTTTEHGFTFSRFPGRVNLDGRITDSFDLADPREPFDLDFQLPVATGHEVAIRVTVDGETPMEMCGDGDVVGSLNLSSPTLLTMRSDILCDTDFTGVATVPGGEYEIEIRGSSAAAVPTYLVPEALVVTGDMSMVVDIPTVLVSGRVTVNGETPVRTDECTGPSIGTNLNFYNLRSRLQNVPMYRFFMPCETTDFTFTERIPVGVYRVTVHRSRTPIDGPSGSTIPNHEHTFIERLDVR